MNRAVVTFIVIVSAAPALVAQYRPSEALATCVEAKNRARGAYASLDELLAGTPSTPADSVAVAMPQDPGELAEGLVPKSFSLVAAGKSLPLPRKTAAVSTGEKVFVDLEGRFFQLTVNPHFCYFTLVERTEGAEEGDYLNAVLILNTEKKAFEELTVKLTEKIIADNGDLLKKFDKDEFKESRLIRYLKQYYAGK